MRFTRGSKIEVFSKRDISLGCWRPAEIISGNGNNYTVKYDRHSADDPDPVVGWVSQNAIRPCPPVKVVKWFAGDIAEVFHYFSWKLATVLKGLGRRQVLVRLHESAKDIVFYLDNIRVRQSWENNKWIMMGKRSCKETKSHDMWSGSRPGLKRMNLLTECESSEAPQAKKYRQVENSCQLYRVEETFISPGESRDALPSHCKKEGNKRGRTSLIIRFPATSQRNETSQRFDSLFAYSSDESSDLCSVGSCSASDSWGQINYGLADDCNGDLSDAESSNAPSHDKKYFLHKLHKEAVMDRIHQLELHAYRSTLRALHASGPISWEQQSLISNLRLSLNISNDEHLLELKTILSNDH